ncbi:unnamed protein product, partial [Arctogadus glacialis]
MLLLCWNSSLCCDSAPLLVTSPLLAVLCDSPPSASDSSLCLSLFVRREAAAHRSWCKLDETRANRMFEELASGTKATGDGGSEECNRGALATREEASAASREIYEDKEKTDEFWSVYF